MSDLEFTGERVVPGRSDRQVEFEHEARYAIASRLVEGRFVVDLGCGTGYGSRRLLEAGAARVTSLDVAPEAVSYARRRFAGRGAHFVVADARKPCLPDRSADIVAAFELVEHVERPEALISAASRLLADDGLFLVSTPNRRTYRDERPEAVNPFHVREFYYDEFLELLSGAFPHVEMLGQMTTEGALFEPLTTGAGVAQPLALGDESDLRETCDYFFAFCGHREERVRQALRGEYVVGRANRLRERTHRVHELQEELEDRTRWAQALAEEVDEKSSRLGTLQEEFDERTRWALELDEEVKQGRRRLSDLRQSMEERSKRAEELEREAQRQREVVAQLRAEIEERIRKAERFQRETDERDRQFLERLKDLERIEAATRTLSSRADDLVEVTGWLDRRLDEAALDRRRLDEATAAARKEAERGLRRTRDALDEAAAEAAGIDARLRWQGDSAIRLASDLERLESASERLRAEAESLSDRVAEGEQALESQRRQLVVLAEGTEWVAQGYADHGRRLSSIERSVLQVRGLTESLPWRGYQRITRTLGRWFGGVDAEQRHFAAELEAIGSGVESAGNPVGGADVAWVLVLRDGGERALASLRSLVALASSNRFEFHVVDCGVSRGLGEALRKHPLWHYRSSSSATRGIRQSLRRSRASRAVVLQQGLSISADDAGELATTVDALPPGSFVAPCLRDAEGELLASEGVASEGTARGVLIDEQNGYGLESSFVRPVAVPPPGILAAPKSSLLGVLDRDSQLFDRDALAPLVKLLEERGGRAYLHPRCVAVCDEPTTADLVGRRVSESRLASGSGTPGHGLRLLVIDHRLPTPDQDSGSLRMMHLLDLLGELGVGITLVPENLLANEPYAAALRRRGIEVVSRPWVESLQDFIERQAHRFDAAMLCRFHVADDVFPVVSEVFQGKPVIFDTVDLQFLREQRRARLEEDADRTRRAEELERQELELIENAAATVVVSEVERQILVERAPEASVRLISNIHDVPGRTRGFLGRRDAFFIGGFEHPPNVDAVCWFVEQVLPGVLDKLPGFKLHVIGSKPTAEVERLESANVEVHGFVEDLGPFLSGCRLSVAPLRYGAGVKGKVNQSLAHGVPCVATTPAAEGMALTHGRDVLIADSVAGFAEQVVRAHRNPWLWYRLSGGGVANTRRHFSREVAKREIAGMLESCGLSVESVERNATRV